MVIIHISCASNSIRACHAFHHHVLALKPNMDVFIKVLEPLVAVPILETNHPVFHISVEDSLVLRWSMKNLDYE
jgi:hypothetical protein